MIKGENSNENIKFFVEEGTVEFSVNNCISFNFTLRKGFEEILIILKFQISDLMQAEVCKTQMAKEDLSDKERYISSYKLRCLKRYQLNN